MQLALLVATCCYFLIIAILIAVLVSTCSMTYFVAVYINYVHMHVHLIVTPTRMTDGETMVLLKAICLLNLEN